MSGIGVRLNKLYSKNTLVTTVAGVCYSTIVTIAPMVLVMVCIGVMQYFLGFNKESYASRELFSSTVLYIFIFSLLTASPFNSVISRYMSDVIFNETMDDIMPCFHVGLLLNVVLSSIVGLPVVIHEYIVGGVDFMYVFFSYAGYMSLMFVFYAMLYLSICKDYSKITIFYSIGMVVAFLLSWLLVKVFQFECTYGMLIGLTIGFFLTACLEMGQLKGYFKGNSRNYKGLLVYLGKYWQLIVANFGYTFGLYAHNFVFWFSDMQLVVVDTYIDAPIYDTASYMAMLTSISATVIFISNVEMRFHERYKDHSEMIIGGKLNDIIRARKRMFRQIAAEIMSIARIQFIISMVLFLVLIVVLPLIGVQGMVMTIYPSLAAAYFVIYILYCALIFLYYFNDLTGAVMTSVGFSVITVLGSIYCRDHLSPEYYGMGVFVGACIGWSIAFFRLRWVERNIERHIFCKGTIIKKGDGTRPQSIVYTKPVYLQNVNFKYSNAELQKYTAEEQR